MLQQIMVAPGEIEFREIPVGVPKENEALLKIQRIGVCGSDIHVYHGKHPYTSYPVTQGHEVSATVVSVGPGVTKIKEHDLVTIQPQVVCGTCYPCTHNQYHICDSLKVMGFQTTGMASQYFLTDVDRILKLPGSMSVDEGAMIEPVAVAAHALSRASSIKGKNIIVMGAGPIGNLVAQAAKGMGAKKVLISDLSDNRLALAKSVGIDATVNPAKESVEEVVKQQFGPDKADLILECVGAQGTIDDAVSVARKGTEIIIVGVFGEKPLVDLGFVQDRELKLIGTAMYQTKDYLTAIELVEQKKIKLQPLMTTHFAFKDYKKAYEFIDSNKDKVMKVFIDIT